MRPVRARLLLTSVAVVLGTAGCGLVPSLGDADKGGVVVEDDGTAPASDALVAMSCGDPKDGTVTVTGVLSNAGKRAARYQVTAFADVADGQQRTGRVAVVGPVAGGGTADFSVEGVPVTGAEPQCRAQVVKLPE